ncbi:isochorismate synthase [Lapillicoccus sp.]|uniref:isochorismate synthase n=1 Tax=Lapillicoccus sp. TaxID=1909287 RepID=UPI003267B937
MSSSPAVPAEARPPGRHGHTDPLSSSSPLVVRTTLIDDPGPLLALLPALADPDDIVSWVRRGEGLVGWGRAARFALTGPDRFAAAERWWQETSSRAVVRDEVQLPGSGPIAFGSFPFADESEDAAVLVVPEVVVVSREGHSWVTTTGVGRHLPAVPDLTRGTRQRPVRPTGVTFADGSLRPAEWERAVARAVELITRGGLDKVVLARDLEARADGPIDPRWLLAQLAERYDRTWTFAVEGLVGATPELLVRRDQGLITSRVLAGTITRTGNDAKDLALAASLARSSKDLEEHEYAVRSVADALAPHCSSMNVPESPFVLHLSNVMHLATDVAGVSADDASSLALAASLHPSAAVGGTPTDVAVPLISALEQMDRGRYAGPVGWLDAAGDGEWGIALRCGRYDDTDPSTMRLFAGCGIVAGSDPDAEVAESDAKLVPMRDALTSD